MAVMKVLILGGTRAGRELARLLVASGHDVVSSLAGRVTRPADIAGQTRVGGFGGVDGLAAYLRDEAIERVVDVTHPFAEQISANAAEACRLVGIPLLRIERPSWAQHLLASNWVWVDDHAAAARTAAAFSRVLLTVGRQSLRHYLELPHVVARMVDPPDHPVPSSWQLRLERGPFTIDDERALLRDTAITALVTKDSGDPLTEAKLCAAAELDVTVIILRRAPAPEGVPAVGTPQEAAAWVATQHPQITTSGKAKPTQG